MFEGWTNFYLMAGSAAAVLIGLIFVVISLMGDRPRSAVLAGSKLYMGPIVLSVSFVLLLSGAALVPDISRLTIAQIASLVAVWGLARAMVSSWGIGTLNRTGEAQAHWTDIWFYGLMPMAAYAAIGGVAIAFWRGLPWAQNGLAIMIVLKLLLAIRNEWDLITWITPRGEDGEAAP